MGESPVDRVRQRCKELGNEIAKLEEERDRLDAYLLVHEEFNRPSPRKVSGREIDVLCQMVLRHASEPMIPVQLVNAFSEQFGAVIDPARLMSTRMSTLASVESTEEGWRLVPSGVELESEACR